METALQGRRFWLDFEGGLAGVAGPGQSADPYVAEADTLALRQEKEQFCQPLTGLASDLASQQDLDDSSSR